MTKAISIEHVSFAYAAPWSREKSVPALRDISLEIDEGEFVALIGRLGAGKTTLCLALNGIVPQLAGGAFQGHVQVLGQDTRQVSVPHMARLVGMVFEEAEVQLFNGSVEDEIAFGLEELGWAPADIERRIDWALETVRLQGMRPRNPRQLSGGEQKRLAIAAILAMEPPILVLDEPTAGLDPRGRQEVMEVISQLARQRAATVVMASQDAEAVAQVADRAILLEDGQVVQDGSVRAVYEYVLASEGAGMATPQMGRVAQILREDTGGPYHFLTPAEALSVLLPSR